MMAIGRVYAAFIWRDEPGVGRRVAPSAGAAGRNCVNKTKHPVLLMDMCLLYPADFRQAF